MAFQNGFRGTTGGAVQTAYTDQPGIAVAGQLAFASDLNYCDALYIGQADGIAAGIGVKLTAVADDISFQRPNLQALLPGDADANTTFGGILVFDESMQSDENGVPGLAKGRIGRIAKPGRAGARIYVKCPTAVDHTADTVNWVTIAPADASRAKGEFCPAALGGGAAGTSVDVSGVARWISSAAAGEVAIVELF